MYCLILLIFSDARFCIFGSQILCNFAARKFCQNTAYISIEKLNCINFVQNFEISRQFKYVWKPKPMTHLENLRAGLHLLKNPKNFILSRSWKYLSESFQLLASFNGSQKLVPVRLYYSKRFTSKNNYKACTLTSTYFTISDLCCPFSRPIYIVLSGVVRFDNYMQFMLIIFSGMTGLRWGIALSRCDRFIKSLMQAKTRKWNIILWNCYNKFIW
jgi:hypothetical protein